MEFEFDKEMDSLLRQTALKDEAAFASNSKSTHVDADEISLFAENALPQKARARVMEHFADCDRCRKILSSVIALNSETASENLHAKEIAVAPSLPWYKKLFAFPQIAYAMGALVLVFSGIIAFIVLKSAGESQNSSIAQVENVQEAPQGARGAGSDGETNLKEVYSMSSNANMAAASNTSANIMVKPDAPLSTANSNALVSRDQKQVETGGNMPQPTPVTAAPQESSAKTAKKEDSAADEQLPAPPPPKREIENRNEGELSKQQAEITQSTTVQNQIQIAPDSRNVQRSLPANERAAARKDSAATTADATEGAKEKTAATRIVKGKTFNRSEGVWYDSAYKQQRPINIRRGTDAYKKLDADLRSIAENLGGVVVVVWKGKTYRIQ